MGSETESPELSNARQPKGAKRIANPRRLLILAPNSESHATIPALLLRLTGAAPDLSQHKSLESSAPIPISPPSFAGYTTHTPLQLRTKYYAAEIPIWVDEVPTHIIPPSNCHSAGEEAVESSEQVDLTLDPAVWKQGFLSDEAREVRDAIGAIIICVQRPKPPDPLLTSDNGINQEDEQARNTPNTIKEYEDVFHASVRRIRDLATVVGEVKNQIEEERGEVGDVPALIVLVGEEDDEQHPQKKGSGGLEALGEDETDGYLGNSIEFGINWWDEELNPTGIGSGPETIGWNPRRNVQEVSGRRNEFGERMGIERVLEVLETHQWSSSSADDTYLDGISDPDLLRGLTEDLDGFSLEATELEDEMAGLRFAIRNGAQDDSVGGGEVDTIDEDDLSVEQLEALMTRVQGIRDMAVDIPEAERKKFAAKAIADLMKDI
ncbi:hypothetical protein FQN57_006030 [Myotisia sp. PD_48]|nr:hypothetical protein FQN57_006030 [Myotisia sp. PD_48]